MTWVVTHHEMKKPENSYWCYESGELHSHSMSDELANQIVAREDAISRFPGTFRLSRTEDEAYPWLLVVCLWLDVTEAYLACDTFGLHQMLKEFVPLCTELRKLAMERRIPSSQ